ncbi:MAG: GNAT family N-acetyltransferase [Promethearchaeota archaeon]
MKNKILKEKSLNSINYYIERNLDDFYIKSSQHSNFNSRLEDKISWIFAKNADWPNCIFRANFVDLNIEHEIREIRKLIKENKAPNGWTVGPLTKPSNLGSFLEENDFSKVYHQTGMAVDLRYIEDIKIENNDLKVKLIKSDKSLKQWAKIVSLGFGIKVDCKLLKFLYLQPEIKFYIGNYKRKTVSTLMLYLAKGIAGLHAVSTLPEYRCKGLGFTISGIALLDAYRMGYEVAVLQASNLGERIYKKLGFQKYCDINSYELD